MTCYTRLTFALPILPSLTSRPFVTVIVRSHTPALPNAPPAYERIIGSFHEQETSGHPLGSGTRTSQRRQALDRAAHHRLGGGRRTRSPDRGGPRDPRPAPRGWTAVPPPR